MKKYMEKETLQVKDFVTLTQLRNQYQDHTDQFGYMANKIQMTAAQLSWYKSLLFDYGKDELPKTYMGVPIEVI